MTASAPTPVLLNPQIVGQAENAHRPALERILGRSGTTFPQWVALRLAATDGGSTDGARLAARIVDALKIAPESARAAIDQLVGAHLVEPESRLEPGTDDQTQVPLVHLTDSGRARFAEIKSAIDEVISQVYSSIPQQDLETAARVLSTLTQRLNSLAA